jgi:hypothetical protein
VALGNTLNWELLLLLSQQVELCTSYYPGAVGGLSKGQRCVVVSRNPADAVLGAGWL